MCKSRSNVFEKMLNSSQKQNEERNYKIGPQMAIYWGMQIPQGFNPIPFSNLQRKSQSVESLLRKGKVSSLLRAYYIVLHMKTLKGSFGLLLLLLPNASGLQKREKQVLLHRSSSTHQSFIPCPLQARNCHHIILKARNFVLFNIKLSRHMCSRNTFKLVVVNNLRDVIDLWMPPIRQLHDFDFCILRTYHLPSI